MQYLDSTLLAPAENLACDEALLDLCEESDHLELLRFWEPATHFVVLGYGNKAAVETIPAECLARRIPVLRRVSGGGTVLQGPGCLNYSLILQIEAAGELQSIAGTNRYILERQAAAFGSLLRGKVGWCGSTDLTLDGMKFSGNAQRRKKRCLLFHGSILINLDLSLLDVILAHPSREPEYRRGRSHREFVRNLDLDAEAVKTALREAWQAKELFTEFPEAAIATLVQEKYGLADWNLKF